MRLLHTIFRHRTRMHEKKTKHTGREKPKKQGPKPHHTGHGEKEAPTQPSKFDRRSGQWEK